MPMKLMKQNKKGKNCAVFCFAGKKKLLFYIYAVIVKQKKNYAADYTTAESEGEREWRQGRGGGREITRHAQEGGEGVAPIWNFLRPFHPHTVLRLTQTTTPCQCGGQRIAKFLCSR